MRRLWLLGLAAALMLSGCGGSTPSSTPTPSSSLSPSPTESVPPPTSTSPSPSPSDDSALRLLPPSCTPQVAFRLSPVATSGAGGWSFGGWRITSGKPCTLYGRPRLTMYEADGQVAPVRFTPHFFGPKTPVLPVVVGPHRPAYATVSTYRCDTEEPVYMTSARIELPLGVDIYSTPVTSKVNHNNYLPYCPHTPGQDVGIAPVSSPTGRPAKQYAVNMRSSFDPGDAPTWGRADIDGDGKPDTVVVTPHLKRNQTDVEVDYASGATASTELHTGSRIRLEAFSDLNGDGVPEILVAGSASPVEVGYQFGDFGATVIQVVGDGLETVGDGTPDWQLSFGDGRGDWWGAAQCQGTKVVQVSASYDSKDHYDLTRTTWRVKDGVATKLGTTTSKDIYIRPGPNGGPSTVVSDCPGMGSNGWAAGS